MGQLAGGVAHDFNNLLTVITGNVELMRTDVSPGTDMAESLQEISQAAQRAAGLTRQLLAYGRRQRMESRLLDLNEVVATLTKMLPRLIGEHIVLQCRLGDSLPRIQGDIGMLEQVLMNLVLNARDAMPRAGLIEIATGKTEVSLEQARRNVDSRPGRFVTLAVRDTGCGMDEKIRSRLFEPFFTTKGIGKGTGLGLAVVDGIVKQHQGWIEVATAVGRGSTFTLFLPQAEQTDVQPLAMPAPASPRGGHETILVVEDERPVRQLVRNVLQRHGYTVLEAANGVEALRLWEAHSEQVALLLTDLVMPEGVSGRDLAQRLLRQRPGLNIIFSSGYSVDLNDPIFAEQAGRNFLCKPYEPEQLLALVRATLDHR